MEIAEYTAEDPDAVEAGRLVLNAAAAVDSPWLPPLTTYRRLMEVRHGWDGSPARHLLGRVGETAVAVAQIELGEWDNVDLAWLGVCVDPAYRRRGHGSELLARAEQISRSVGRTKVGAEGWDLPATTAFADRHDYELAATDACRVVRPRQLPPGLVTQVAEEASPHAAGYELRRFAGRTPEALLDRLAVLTEAINDAPTDDLDIEDEHFPVERVRRYETVTLDSGFRLYRVVAVHRASGELAGHTVVVVDAETPTLAHQHDTAVTQAHRGHRLGLLLKADLMRWLEEQEPQVESIDTWNAESNAHMIAVNERLGYRVVGRELAFQRRH